MARADLISIRCRRRGVPFFHYGIDIGDGTVVHLATEPDGNSMSVQRVSQELFADSKAVDIELSENSLADDEVIERALEAMGRRGYHLVEANCEHFAREIKTGVSHSIQVDMFVSSVVRTAFTGMANTASRNVIASSIAILTRSRLLVTAGALVPTIAGEVARCGVYAAAKRFKITHKVAETSSRSVGYAGSALGGFLVGGPVGSLGALAISYAADRVTDRIQKKLNDQSRKSL